MAKRSKQASESAGDGKPHDRPGKPKPSRDPFPIVGIGASAGGFDALRRILEAMPADSNVALVIVQHLAPDKPSLAPSLLAKYTSLQVVQVTDKQVVQPNHVYVIPPGKFLGIHNGCLRLSNMEGPRGAPVAIDFFLRSLAKDQRQCAVGVILSGTGSDGTLGVKAIKQEGGLVLAQDIQTAEHGGMPESAIQTGVVDDVLPPEEIPAALVRFARHSYVCDSPPKDPPTEPQTPAQEETSDALSAIVGLLRQHGNRDFRNYKETTLLRRTRRRMCLHHIDDFNEYLDFLNDNPGEVEALGKDLLISVTDFFRDREAWEELATTVIPAIVNNKSNDDAVRVWVAGCATGEEAYSIAMLVLEELQRNKKACTVQIFASDIDKDAIAFARAGRYSCSIEADVSAPRLKRFFSNQEGDVCYQVNKLLREAVVFADQDLIGDPPFSQLDLVCCRNVLIYLKPDVQQKIVALFHFSLREGGYLMLGTAETVGRQEDLFQTLSKRWRIYRRIGPTRHERVEIPVSSEFRRRGLHSLAAPPRRELQLTHLAQQKLLDMIAPRAVLIDRHWRILYISGDVDSYLTHKSGVPNDDLLSKARDGLRSKLRGAVHKAYSEKSDVSITCRITRQNTIQNIRVDVRLVANQDHDEELALVVFDEPADGQRWEGTATPSKTKTNTANPIEMSSADISEDTIIRQLEEELAAAKDDLQATIEQFEASNEEYKASNEEVMSVNEELQSTNEELETSKEELQSLNEELSTVNHQLGAKVQELETKHADLENLISATEVATICLDTDLTIRWFTDAVQQLIRIKPTDRGRPLNDLAHDFVQDDLGAQCEQVLKRLSSLESEITCHDGRAYIRRIVPYRTDDHRIGGVVITLVDITARRKREEDLRTSQERFRRALSVDGIGVLFFDDTGTLLDCNDWFLSRTGYTRGEVESGRLTAETMTPPEWHEVTSDQFQMLQRTGRIGPYEKEYFCKDGQRLWMMLSGCALEDGTIVVHCIDISDRKQAESELRESEQILRMAASAARLGWYSHDLASNRVRWASEMYELFGLSPEEPLDLDRIAALVHTDDRQRFSERARTALQPSGPHTYEEEFRIVRPGGELRWLVDRGKVLFTQDGDKQRPIRNVGMVIDVTERRQADERLRELNRTLENQVAQRTELLSLLQDVTRGANEARTVEDAMRAALSRIASYDGWLIGHVWRLADDNSGQLVSSGYWQLSENRGVPVAKLEKYRMLASKLRIDTGDGLVGSVMASGQPRWIEDIALDPAMSLFQVPDLLLHAAVALPITIDAEVVAVMEFFSELPSHCDERFFEILPDIGIQLGHVIQRMRLERIVAEIANEEQRRIGRELHDGISQQLTGGSLIAESLRQKLQSESSVHIDDAAHLIQILKETHEGVRHLASGLMPSTVASAELLPSLRAMAIEVSRRFEVDCVLESEHYHARFLRNDATAFVIFQVAREAVHNAVKHAGASEIVIELTTGDCLQMVVRDNGCGFDLARPQRSTNGLRIMKYRADSIGGGIEIESTKDQGTSVTLRIPPRSCQP